MKNNALTIGVFVLLIGLFAFAANDWKVPWAGKPVHGKDWCEAHQVALSTCEKCKPELARGGTYSIREREPKEGECPNTLVRVHLAPDVAKQIDLTYHAVESRPVSETLQANAEVLYPPARYARIAPRIHGTVREVKGVLGEEVEAGALLAVVEAAELGQAKSDYLQAASILKLRQKTFDREQTLLEKKLTTGREVQEAETQLEEAKIGLERASRRLSTLGLSAEQVKDVVEKRDTAADLQVTAPFAGTLVEASAVPGEIAGPEKPLFAVAAVDRLWISIDVFEADLSKVEKGRRVLFTVEGLPGKRFPGKVVAVGGEVDDRTRTVRVYAEVKNVDGLLRAKMFGRAELTVKPPEPKLLVPKEAVQNDGDCFLVFVSPSSNAFKARKISIGTVYEQGYEVTGGLVAGEKIVAKGSFLLRSEVMRGQMGAG